ncbi:hypothetical protein ACFY3J_14850 [Streptomyces sp. NPDC001231]
MNICIAPGDGLLIGTVYCAILAFAGLVLIAVLEPIWTVVMKLFRR